MAQPAMIQRLLFFVVFDIGSAQFFG
jgi:hypothetical protein